MKEMTDGKSIIIMQTSTFLLAKTFRHKRSLNIAKQLKTRLQGIDLVGVVVFDFSQKKNACLKGLKVFAHLAHPYFVHRKLWEEVRHRYLAQCSGSAS